MRILVLGAGVIGSFNAVRLQQGGHEVELLARGRRLEDLRRHGVVLEQVRTGRRSAVFVPLIEHIDPRQRYDLALVVVRRDQVASVLPLLAVSHRTPTFLFLGNNAAGPGDMIDALGRERVMTGMVNAGGERDGPVVRYLWTSRLPLLFGEPDNVPRARDDAIRDAFRAAGLPARYVRDIEAYQKTHAAGLPAFAGALYRANGDVRALAHDRVLVDRFLGAYREALIAVRRDGTPLRPGLTHALEWIPLPILTRGVSRFLDTRLAVTGGQAHANAAPGEMKALADELRSIFERTGVPHPASRGLFESVDARAAVDGPFDAADRSRDPG